MPSDIKHPVLGTLSWKSDLSVWETKIELRSGCPIDLRLSNLFDSAPTNNIDKLLQGGVDLLDWARRTESACRERIADELLELHNDTWIPEGTTPMGRAEFIKRISPNGLVRDTDGSGYFYWADGDMFAGHWIEVRFGKDQTISQVGLAG